MDDWKYVFDLFMKHSPGFTELYQNQCRVYLDEYDNQSLKRDSFFIRNFFKYPESPKAKEIIKFWKLLKEYNQI